MCLVHENGNNYDAIWRGKVTVDRIEDASQTVHSISTKGLNGLRKVDISIGLRSFSMASFTF